MWRFSLVFGKIVARNVRALNILHIKDVCIRMKKCNVVYYGSCDFVSFASELHFHLHCSEAYYF